LKKLVNIHTHSRDTGNKSISVVSRFVQEVSPQTEFDGPVSVGLHPWHINKVNVNEQLENLEAICDNPKMLAVGECGLDRSVSVNIEKQKDIFLKQNEIAIAHDLPVIIHSVKSYSDFLALLKQRLNKTPWIFHGFSGNFQIAKRLIDFGAYISLGSALLKDFSKTNETMKKTTLQRIFLETDEDDKANIEEIYRKASQLTGISYDEFTSQIYQNFIFCFNYGVR